MDFDREWIVLLERGDARILVRHGGRLMVRYAAMLQIFREGRWQTIRLIDNAHNEHHMHRYAGDVKQDAYPSRPVMPGMCSQRLSRTWYEHRNRSTRVGTDDV
jgi:hypothetical protein